MISTSWGYSDHLPLKEKCRVSQNWTRGCFRDVILAKHSSRQLPWLQLTNSCLWVSTGSEIRCYRQSRRGCLREEKRRKLCGPQADVSRFSCNEQITVAGSRDGSVVGWFTDSGDQWFYCDRVHNSETQCVDCYNSTIISGSRDKTVKVLFASEEGAVKDRLVLDFPDRVWSLGIAPGGSSFAVGTSGCLGDVPLSLWDLNSGSKIYDLRSRTRHRRGAGVLDLHFQSPQTLLSCGYDTFMRLWDTRTGSCVSQWEEPYDSALYCVQSDLANVIVTGTCRHGMTRFWDKRQIQPLKAYYCGVRNSPVYSLAFDQGHMYVALDLSLNMLDFSIYS